MSGITLCVDLCVGLILSAGAGLSWNVSWTVKNLDDPYMFSKGLIVS